MIRMQRRWITVRKWARCQGDDAARPIHDVWAGARVLFLGRWPWVVCAECAKARGFSAERPVTIRDGIDVRARQTGEES